MKEIPLTQGKVALVDDADYDALMVRSWCYSGGYAWAKINGRKESMHRFLMNAPKGMDVDHINGNGCDNRRCNMRLATRTQNNHNRHRQTMPGSVSQYKGVYWDKTNGKWAAGVRINGKQHFLGYFVSEIDAARAYDSAAKQLTDGFATLNFPENGDADIFALRRL